MKLEHVLNLIHILHRRWMRAVTTPEFKVLTFVFDRTCGWSKKSERITLDHFQAGVWQGRKCITGGTGLTRPTIIAALANLTGNAYRDGKGRTPLVRTKYDARSVHYELNFDCMLPIPKRLRDIGKEALPSQSKPFTPLGKGALPTTVKRFAPKIDKQDKEQDKKSNMQDDSDESPRESVRRIIQKHKERRHSKAEKALNPGSSLHDLQRLWKAVVLDVFPGSPVLPWTAQQMGMVSTLRKKWIAADNAKSEFGVFLHWCIVNWETVMHFAFPSKAARARTPDKPAISFLVKCAQTFIDAFHDGTIKAKRKSLSRHELEKREERVAELRDEAKKLRKEVTGHRQTVEEIKAQERLAKFSKKRPHSKPVADAWKPDRVAVVTRIKNPYA